jgi:hypothetical protein
VSVSIILQNIAQLKALFDTKLVLKFLNNSTVEARVSLGENSP